jgi:putative SOS response-associated peptidase YedK
MPVILSRDAESSWLDPANQDAATLQAMLRAYPAGEMEADGVNPALNKPGFEGPECLEPPPAGTVA